MAKIGVDIGHGSNTFPPDKGVNKNGKGYAEHDFNSKLGMAVKDLLEQNGHTVILGQQPNATDVSLTTRTNLYNREKVDLVISVHANAGAASAAGRCVFYWGTSADGKQLAEKVRDEIKEKGYSTHSNGLHAGKIGSWTNLHITRETKSPAILVEHGFMTNSSDFELIFGSKQDQYIKDMAEADVKGIQNWLGNDFKGEASTPSTPKPSTPSTSVAGAKLVKNENAFFLVTEDDGIKVRNAPSTTATHTGTLEKGDSINYFKVYEGNGYRWLQYTGNSGNTLYVPYRPSNDVNEQWGTFHDERPGGSKDNKEPEVLTTNVAVGEYVTVYERPDHTSDVVQTHVEGVKLRAIGWDYGAEKFGSDRIWIAVIGPEWNKDVKYQGWVHRDFFTDQHLTEKLPRFKSTNWA